MNRPYGFGGDLSQHTDKSQFESLSKHTGIIPSKRKMGARKETPTSERSLPSANTGRAPSGMGATMFALPPLGEKKPFPKKVFAELFP